MQGITHRGLLDFDIHTESDNLKKRLEYINQLQNSISEKINGCEGYLQFKFSERMDPTLRTLDDLKHELIGFYLRKNITSQPELTWFLKREERASEYMKLNAFNPDFGMRFEPLRNRSSGKEVIFNNHPSITFHEILIGEREETESKTEGVRHAGRAVFEFDLDRRSQGTIRFRTIPITLPREIKDIAQIPEGEFYVKDSTKDKYRLAICIENENYVSLRDGHISKASVQLTREQLAGGNIEMTRSVYSNPVTSTFRMMKFYYADEGREKIRETRNILWNSVHIEKEKYTRTPAKEFTLDIFLADAEKLGIRIMPYRNQINPEVINLKYELI